MINSFCSNLIRILILTIGYFHALVIQPYKCRCRRCIKSQFSRSLTPCHHRFQSFNHQDIIENNLNAVGIGTSTATANQTVFSLLIHYDTFICRRYFRIILCQPFKWCIGRINRSKRKHGFRTAHFHIRGNICQDNTFSESSGYTQRIRGTSSPIIFSIYFNRMLTNICQRISLLSVFKFHTIHNPHISVGFCSGNHNFYNISRTAHPFLRQLQLRSFFGHIHRHCCFPDNTEISLGNRYKIVSGGNTVYRRQYRIQNIGGI